MGISDRVVKALQIMMVRWRTQLNVRGSERMKKKMGKHRERFPTKEYSLTGGVLFDRGTNRDSLRASKMCITRQR